MGGGAVSFRRQRLGEILLGAWLVCSAVADCRAAGAESQGLPGGGAARFVAMEPERMRALFRALEVERPGLEAVRAAVEGGRWEEACRELLQYHADRHPAPAVQFSGQSREEAEGWVRGEFVFQGIAGIPPRRRDGGLDWNWPGPRADREWGYMLNRHAFLEGLLAAWRQTGRARYLEALTVYLDDWIRANPAPARATTEAPWRAMEAGRRLADAWPELWEGLAGEPSFPDDVKLLFLSSVPEQAEACRKFHARAGNHLLTEMLGLASAAAHWPEFRDAGTWRAEAWRTVEEELGRQVYPDGAQKELSDHYQRSTLQTLERFAALEEGGGPAGQAVRAITEKMWAYAAQAARPGGRGPLNNDGDQEEWSDALAAASARYGRDDWKAARGADFPFAGQTVLRSGFGDGAMWAFFDHGPAGLAHQHRDRLHLSVSAFGRDFLVDNGRYRYAPDAWRAYFTGTAAHNVLRPAGADQRWGEDVREEARPGQAVFREDYAFALGTHDAGYHGERDFAVQKRAVLAWPGAFWLVVDEWRAIGPRDLETLWHFDPSCTVAAWEGGVQTQDKGRANLAVLPAEPGLGTWNLVSGETSPEIQGWHSPAYNEKVPATAAIWRHRTNGPSHWGWLLVPARPGQSVEARIHPFPAAPGQAAYQVEIAGRGTWRVRVDFEASTAEQAVSVVRPPL